MYEADVTEVTECHPVPWCRAEHRLHSRPLRSAEWTCDMGRPRPPVAGLPKQVPLALGKPPFFFFFFFTSIVGSTDRAPRLVPAGQDSFLKRQSMLNQTRGLCLGSHARATVDSVAFATGSPLAASRFPPL